MKDPNGIKPTACLALSDGTVFFLARALDQLAEQ